MRNGLILQSNGGTVIAYASRNIIGISAGDLSARCSPTVGRLQTKREASEVAPQGPTVLTAIWKEWKSALVILSYDPRP